MSIAGFRASLAHPAPAATLAPPVAALWWAAKGDWEKAHTIVQSMEGVQAFDWVHALMHWIEADMGNADYWYRRAGKKRATASVAAEWQHIAVALSGVTKH